MKDRVSTLVVLLVSSQFAVSCSFSSWEAKEYVVKEGPPREFQGESLDSFSEFQVGEVLFKTFLKGAVEGIHQGHGPFTVYFSAWAKSGSSPSVRILAVSGKSSSGEVYELIAAEDVPLSLTFKPLRVSGTNRTCQWATWNAKRQITPEPKKKEHVSVSFELEVRSGDTVIKKELNYEFVPRIRSGKVKWPTI